MAEWWEEEGVFVTDVATDATTPAWWEEEGAVEEPMEVTPFPMEPGTSRAAQELPELLGVGVAEMLPEETGIAEGLGVAYGAVTMTDPAEIAQMLSQYPNIGISYAPDGTIMATNNDTDQRVVINRPGLSGADALQGLGLMAAFAPGTGLASLGVRAAGKQILTQTARRAARKKWQTAAKTAVATGVTEAGLQAGQVGVGGEFDVGDIAFSAVAGAVPDIVAAPVMRGIRNIPEVFKPMGKVFPKTLVNALKLAKEKGRTIATSDALWDTLPPFMQTAFSAAKRLPWILGTGKQQTKKTAERLDLLTELVDEYDIDITTDLGQEISDSILKKMVTKRFWGKNKSPSLEMIERAFRREAKDVQDKVLKRHLNTGDIDAHVVDAILDSGRTSTVKQMVGMLTKDGKIAARKRLIGNGLVEAGWTPGNPGAADPSVFFKFLDKQQTRKSIDVLFNNADRNLLDGAREYLRLTGRKASSDAGPSLAVAAIIMSMSVVAGPTVRFFETGPIRQAFLKIHHAKGNDKLIEKIMKGVRPALISFQNLMYTENSEFDIPDIVPDMVKRKVKSAADITMGYLRDLVGGGTSEDAAQRLEEMIQ